MSGRKSLRPNGGCLRDDGYVTVTRQRVTKLEHVMVAERALGKPLPITARVHHVDENRSNNEPSNLVICPSEAYHKLLHQRMRAMAACGNPNWRICTFCGHHDDPENLYIRPSNTQAWHKACRNALQRATYVKKENRK